MTDAEIMKGVKLCNGDLGNCKECPFDSIGKTCGIELAKAEIGLIERLQAENVALYKAFEWALDRGDDVCGKCAYYIPPRPDEDYTDCGHYGECVKGIVEYFKKNG